MATSHVFTAARFFSLAMLAALSFRSVIAATKCEDIKGVAIPLTTVTTAETVPAGNFTPPGAAAPLRDLPSFCRVAGIIRPTESSEIKFEVWMPVAGWNNRFQGIGNGGFAGSISYPAMAAAILSGYATASTDTGHRGGDASWALGQPEKLIDYGHRAVHEMTEKAKLIVASFFGQGPKYSYFSSCSNGGRQALMEAQRYPQDYDGIIAGAPANYMSRVFSGFAWNLQALLKDSRSYIPASKLKAIENAVLTSCDLDDGVKDGVVGNPSGCRFKPSDLLCKGDSNDECLTLEQILALERIYSGPKTSRGQQIVAGFAPGGETGPGGWSAWITGSQPRTGSQYFFATQAFRYMVYGNPDWDFMTFDIEKDAKAANDKLAGILNAEDPNLKAFKARGGRLILYHGWSDAALPPVSTIEYFRSVQKAMGDRQTSEFTRLFMVPGMQHCGGGPGPNAFGAQVTAQQGSADTDMTRALERWVEQGVAPDRIIATRRFNTEGQAPSFRSRPLCPYPQTAKYKGSGSTDDAANFVCAAP